MINYIEHTPLASRTHCLPEVCLFPHAWHGGLPQEEVPFYEVNCHMLLQSIFMLYLGRKHRCVWVIQGRGCLDLSAEGEALASRPWHPQIEPFSILVSQSGLLVDRIQVGHYLDNVFAFRAEMCLRVGLGEMAAEAGILSAQWQVWGLRMEPRLRMWAEQIQDPACWPPQATVWACLSFSPGPKATSSRKPSRPLLVPPLWSVYLPVSSMRLWAPWGRAASSLPFYHLA